MKILIALTMVFILIGSYGCCKKTAKVLYKDNSNGTKSAILLGINTDCHFVWHMQPELQVMDGFDTEYSKNISISEKEFVNKYSGLVITTKETCGEICGYNSCGCTDSSN